MGHCGGALGVREKCGRCMCSFELWSGAYITFRALLAFL